ncbi:MAG: hypothetical protein IJ113_00900 [Eggerthellaceae bacterium]|nr:hypothetical protein [Eggerthellaceae bacterium]
MQPSKAQKGLKTLSIISIVLAALGILLGILFIMGGTIIGSDPGVQNAVSSETGLSGTMAGPFLGIMGIIMIVSAGLELLMGIFGVRAAGDNQKIMPAWVFALLSLVFGVISAIGNVTSGGDLSHVLSVIASLVISVLFFWFANTVKKEAGK